MSNLRKLRAVEPSSIKLSFVPKLTHWSEMSKSRVLSVKIARALKAFLFIDTDTLLYGKQRSRREQLNFTLYRVAVLTFQILCVVRQIYLEYLLHIDPDLLDWHGDFYR